VSGPGKLRQRRLEPFHLGPENVLAMIDDPQNGAIDRFAEDSALRRQIDE
jgi:hypothetical protein